MAARLREYYDNVVRKELQDKFGYDNPMMLPKLDKIVLNMGVGDAVNDQKKVQGAVKEMTMIAGQRPVVTKARVSVATFKLREGMSIGCKVTLRKDRCTSSWIAW